MLKHLLTLSCGLSVLALAGCNNGGTPASDNTAAPAGGNSSSGNTSTTGTNSATDNSSLTIAVIPKGTTHVYWKSVEAGALKAGKELGVKISWKGPVKEDDRAQQIGIVQQFVSDGISGIVLAPLDDTALASPVSSAKDAKIPVVIIDSSIKGTPGKDFTSYVATDNHQGGVLGGQRLAKLLGGKGKVVLLRYQVGSASTVQREAGFMEVMKQNPGITMLVENRFAGPTTDTAKTSAMQLVDKLKDANGIFCPNESSTMGMLLALRQNGLAGKVKFVGFDTSPALIEALKAKEIDGLVAQNPTKMGYLGVKTCVDAIHGKAAPATIDTGVTLIDNDNINTPPVQELLGTK